MTAENPNVTLPAATHASRVLEFQRDLAAAKNDLSDVIQKHITTGEPVVIESDVYYQLRRSVAYEFGIHPSCVILVGSCRTGFSLKPKKRYECVRSDSDVDVAVISESLFDDYWDQVFDLTRSDRGWGRSEGKSFSVDLFMGWITPQRLPNRPRFKNSRKWAEVFDDLTAKRICGIRTITARLYRSWKRLEAYQEIMVSQCRNDLRKGTE